MALDQRNDKLAADWQRLRELVTTGKVEQAQQHAQQLAGESHDRYRSAQALVALLAMQIALQNHDALLPLLLQVEERLETAPHPRLIGEYRVCAAGIAYDRRSYGLALRHAVEAERALQQMDERTLAAVTAWDDLAAVYSNLGYLDRALDAAHRCQSLCAEAGLPPAFGAATYTRVHAAAYLDHSGDTAGCVGQLVGLVEQSRTLVADLTVANQLMLAYAVRRLAALGHPVDLTVPVARDVGPNLQRVNALGDACDALAARRPDQALALLDAAAEPLSPLGKAEPLRLRSLAHAQLGDHAGALAAERAMHLLASLEERELRRLLVDSVGARIDQDELRQSAERHARAALTDPLTGLPNRRKVDEFTAELVKAGGTAALGMLDLDRFKAINDHYGHPTGDIVLQRVAGILAREARRTDLAARSGGDEFVLVLPDTSMDDAQAFGEKVEAAINDEDWQSVVPDTPVAVSIGWGPLDSDLDAAYRAADTALYETKRRHRT